MATNHRDAPGRDPNGPGALAQELQGLDGVRKAEVHGSSYHGCHVRVYSDGIDPVELSETVNGYDCWVSIV